MSTIISRELLIDFDNAATYINPDGKLTLQIKPNAMTNLPSVAAGLHYNSTLASAYGTLTTAAMETLYPNEYAVPNKVDAGVRSAYRYHGSTEDANSVYMTINDIEYSKAILTTTPTDATQMDITDITTTRDNTVIKCYITRNNSSTNMYTGVAVGSNYYLKFYFKQVMCHAVASTAGIAAVSVSNPTPYIGESVTYTATLASEDVVFYGWSTDMSGTSIISQDLSYTCSPTDDMVLYALSSSTSAPTTNHETEEGDIAYLTDSNMETYWRTNSEQQTGTYVQYMFYQPIFFIGLQTESITYPDECISSGSVLQVTYDDGTTWETVGRFTGESSCTIVGIHKENVTGVRIYVEEASGTKLCVNEIIMYYTITKPICEIVKGVYKKVDGAWVEWKDMLSLFDYKNTFTQPSE